MARNGRTGQVAALVQQIPKKQEWQRTSKTADKASSTLGKDKALFDAITSVVKSALSDLYNVPKNDPRLIAIIRTIVDYVNGSIKQQLDENTKIEKIVENTKNIVDSDKLKSIVENALKKTAKESITSKEQYEKLSKSISKVVISNLFESKDYEKHKALLEDIKSQLNVASKSLNKIVDNKTATEQKSSKQDKADKSKTDFNKQFASFAKMLQKINGICQSIASKQKDLSKSLNKSVKMLDAAQTTSNKIKDQVKQSAKIQTDVKNITTTGFNQTEKQIKDVNKAVEEANENIKDMQSGSMLSSMFSGTVGLAFKALGFIGKILFAPIKFIFKWILKPIFGFVGGAIGGLLKGVGSLIAAPFKLLMKGIGKVLDAVTNTLAKTLGTFFMTPAGMYTIGYIAGFVWTMWLKDWWEKIKNFFNSETWKTIKSTAMVAFDWICTFFTKTWPELKDLIGAITDDIISFFEQIIAVVNPELYKKIQEYKAKKIDAETDKLLKESDEQKTERANSAINDANATAISNILDASKTVKDIQDNLNEQINDTKVISDTLENLKTPTVISPGGFSADQAVLLVKGVKSIFNRLKGKTEETLEGDLAVAQAKERKAIAEIGQIPEEFKDKYTSDQLANIANSQDKTLRLLKLQGDIAAEQYAKEKGFADLDEYSDEYMQLWDETLANKKQSNDVNTAIQQTEVPKAKIFPYDSNDSIFISPGWQSIDNKWIYGDYGENNSEYARAVKTGTPIVQANTTLSKDQFQQLFTRQQGLKVEDVTFDNLQSALAESGLSIGGVADVGSSKQLAKNIATYLSDTQKQIDAMPAEEQRAWQTKLNETIHRLIEAIDKRQPQQNLMYLQVGQQSLNPADYDK